MSAHTPGPWRMTTGESRNQRGGFSVEVPGFVICGRAGVWPVREAESIANARLIASAPDLYEALKAAHADLQASAEASHMTDGFAIGADGFPCRRDVPATSADRLLQMADAALSKAEGKA